MIQSAAASFACAAIPKEAAAGSGVLAGAIRFDPWYVSSGSYTDIATVRDIQDMLSPLRWHYLAPWFCSERDDHKITCDALQTNMDTEILCAVNGGFRYFLFEQQTRNSALGVAKTLYDNSANKDLIRWSWIGGLSGLGSTGNHQAEVASYVANFRESNYMKVLTNRPLFFIFWREEFFRSSWRGSYTSLADAVSALRKSATQVGLGSPYIVIIDTLASSAVANALGAGADAISFYNQSFYGSFAGLARRTRGEWTSWNNAARSARLGYVPTTVTGWDMRPQRRENRRAGNTSTQADCSDHVTTPGTVSQIAALAKDCVNFSLANPQTCASTVMNVCAWDENVEEGSPLMPSFGDPLQRGNTNSILSALAPVLK